jgi:hypothetical protein
MAREQGLREELTELSLDSDGASTLETVTRDLTRFLLTWGVMGRAVGPGYVSKGLVAPAVSDMIAFSSDEPRLSGMIAEADVPGLSSLVETFLVSDPDDSEAMAKFKQGMEGIVIGGAVDKTFNVLSGVYHAARGVKAIFKARVTGKPASVQQMPGNYGNGRALEEADALAAREAHAILSSKVALKPGDDPATVATLNFEAKLQELGVWDSFPVPDRMAKLQWFNARAKTVFDPQTGSLLPPIRNTSVADRRRWNEAYEKNVKAVEEIHKKQHKVTLKTIMDSFERAWIDSSGSFRSALEATPDGAIAAEKLALSAGATTHGDMIVTQAVRDIYRRKVPRLPIYREIDKADRALLDRTIFLRRMSQVKSYKEEFGKSNELTKHDAVFYEEQMQDMRAAVGEEKWTDLLNRSDKYFEVVHKQLDGLLDSGVISKEEHQALYRFKYSPLRYIRELDQPVAKFTSRSGETISVSSSGILPLQSGSKEVIQMDSEQFLQEIVVRSTSKAARNKANVALFRMAEKGDSPFVKSQIPKGQSSEWVEISVKDAGETKQFYLSKDYAEQWAASPKDVGAIWRAVGTASGAPLVRAGATGALNPEFALSNFPRDMVYNMMVSNQYSGFWPRAFQQYGEDLAEIIPDVLNNGPMMRSYIERGGGMEFLTHQGMLKPGKRTVSAARDMQDIVAYLNTTSEEINRLTVMNRTLKNIKKEHGPDYVFSEDDLDHAVFTARSTIDFHQGGTYSKALNEMFPYLNAGIQGLRGTVRFAKNNPAKAAGYAGQLLGVYAAFDLASKSINPEAHSAVPEFIDNNFMTLTTPYSFIDEEGDRRWMYFKIPIDHSTIGLNVLGKSLNRAWSNEGLPNEKQTTAMQDMANVLKSQFGMVPGAQLPPVISGMVAYAGNFDWWRQSPAWTGEQGIPASMEFLPGRTPPIFADIAALAKGGDDDVETGVEISPERAHAAIRQIMPDNIFTQSMGMGYKMATENVDREVLDPLDKSLVEKLKSVPFVRKYIGFTSPHASAADLVEEAGAEARGPQVRINRQVDRFATEIAQGTEGRTMESAAKWISQEVPPEMRTAALEKLTDSVSLSKFYSASKYDDSRIYLPSRKWWSHVASQPPAARAKLVAEQVAAMSNLSDDGQRKKAKQAFISIMGVVPGFMPNPNSNPQYYLYLNREFQRQGIKLEDFTR